MKNPTKDKIVKELLRRFMLPMPDAYQWAVSTWFKQQLLPYFDSIQDKKLLSDALIDLFFKYRHHIGANFVQHYVETYAIKEDFLKSLEKKYESLDPSVDIFEKQDFEDYLRYYGLLDNNFNTEINEFLELAKNIRKCLKERKCNKIENDYIYNELDKLIKIVRENKHPNKPRRTDIGIAAVKIFNITDKLTQDICELAEKYRKLPDPWVYY